MEIAKESIFISAIRSLLKTLFGAIGIFIAFLPIILILTAVSSDTTVNNKTIFTPLPDLNGNKKILPMSTPVILQVNIEGVVGQEQLTAKLIETQLIESRKNQLKNDRVKGILLNINTPGGLSTDGYNIYYQLKKYKEKYNVPIYAYINGLCSSAGMEIACTSDKIFASPPSMIGNVGVFIGPFFNVKDALEKWGVNSKIISEGKDKTMMSPFTTWKEDEDKYLKAIVEYSYKQFVKLVTSARPKITEEALVNEYGAGIFDPEKAEEIGFIDQISDYDIALKELLTKANIDETKPYQIVELKPRHKFLEELIQGESLLKGKLKHTFQFDNQESCNSLKFLF